MIKKEKAVRYRTRLPSNKQLYSKNTDQTNIESSSNFLYKYMKIYLSLKLFFNEQAYFTH